MITKRNLLVTLENMPCEMLALDVVSKADVMNYIETVDELLLNEDILSNAPWKGGRYTISTPLYLSRVLRQPISLDTSMVLYYIISHLYKREFHLLTEKATCGAFSIEKLKDAVVHAEYFKNVMCESESQCYTHCMDVASDFSEEMILNVIEKCSNGWFIAHETFFAVLHEMILLLKHAQSKEKIALVIQSKRLPITSRERSLYLKAFPSYRFSDDRSGLPCVTTPVPCISIT
jgi:hypothetical protein